jgi:hypothetical protein
MSKSPIGKHQLMVSECSTGRLATLVAGTPTEVADEMEALYPDR